MALDPNDPLAVQRTADRVARVNAYEWQVRPFLDPNAGKRLLNRIVKRRAKAGDTGEASITWGQASNFDVVDDSLPSVQIVGGENNQQEDPSTTPPEQLTLTYTEISRKTTRVTITDADNSENSLVVERIDEITFDGPDHIYRTFVLKWT